jgi:GntR family transcriptional regulator/MocR family aminotransferase
MRGRGDFFLPQIALDRASRVPLHVQLRTQVGDAIRRNAAVGGRLPSTRTLARILGVSRNTVLTAYGDLAADGLIQGQHGSGMAIAATATRSLPPFELRSVLEEAQYPARAIYLADMDGNSLYLVY